MINATEETKKLAEFLEPFAIGVRLSGEKELGEKLSRAAYWLNKLSRDVCGKGYIGCGGGEKCSSDHK
jgi:hypothetical protein